MPATMRSRLTVASVMVSVALFVASGGGAYAATSFVGASGTVHGCVSKNGKLTVLKRGKTKCPKGQTGIAWNQSGPAGQTGAQGGQGPKGDQGPADGPAGGALAGSFPNPALNVSGGPCPRGKFLSDLSALSALTCGPGLPFTALGDSALASNTTGDQNTAVGRGALKDNTSGCCNSAFGDGALDLNTTGEDNSAFGESALFRNQGDNNSAFGENALLENLTGDENSAVGVDALGFNTTGDDNAAFGQHALFKNNTGSLNSAVGRQALAANTSGVENTAAGDSALVAATNGDNNTALGSQALAANTVGSENVAVGRLAGGNLTGGSFNIDIANQGVAGESGAIRIGTSTAQTKAFIAGVNGAGVDQNTPVLVGSDGKLGTGVSSSRRFKTDIRPLRSMRRLLRLRPVSYRYKPHWAGGDRRIRYGLIAEEVAKSFPALVQYGRDGKPNGVRYGDLPVLLLAQLQREHAHTRHLRHRINHQQRQIDRLAAHLHALARRH